MSDRINPYAPPSSDELASALDSDVELRTANPGSRFFAVFIAALLNLAVAVPGFIILYTVADLGLLRYAEVGDVPLLPFAAIFGPVLLFECYQWYLISTTGQSLGKRWNNIKIVKTDGSEAGFLHGVFLRSWICYGLLSNIPVLGGLWSIITFIGLFFVFSGIGRTVHDHLAGTRVVEATY